MSVFAIIKKNGRVLVCKPADLQKWQEEWAPNLRIYEPSVLSVESQAWRFPSSYIKEGEAPSDTLRRLMKDQLGIEKYRVASNSFYNFYDQSRRYPEHMHWDYCFVYDVDLEEDPKMKPWFSALEFVDLKGMKIENFGSAQGWLARALGMI